MSPALLLVAMFVIDGGDVEPRCPAGFHPRPDSLMCDQDAAKSEPYRASADEAGSVAAPAPMDRHDRILHYLAFVGGSAMLDVWGTGYCRAKYPGQCGGVNPLEGKTDAQLVAVKGVQVAAFALLSDWRERRGHKTQAIVSAAVSTAMNVAFFIRGMTWKPPKEQKP